MIYSEAERKEIERVYGVFKDYIHASKQILGFCLV